METNMQPFLITSEDERGIYHTEVKGIPVTIEGIDCFVHDFYEGEEEEEYYTKWIVSHKFTGMKVCNHPSYDAAINEASRRFKSHPSSLQNAIELLISKEIKLPVNA